MIKTGKKNLKAYFINAAQKGQPKPNAGTNEYAALYRYIKTNPEFKAKLESINPDWLPKDRMLSGKLGLKDNRHTGEKHKEDLIILAELGQNRPKSLSTLGRAFYFLCRKDPEFKAKIKAIRPEWFKNGKPELQTLLLKHLEEKIKPKSGTAVYKRFKYLTDKYSMGRNQEFVDLVKQTNPDWLPDED